MASKNEVFTILNALARCYPNFELEKETLAVYTRMLQDIPSELLQVATIEYATHGKFFPSVAEIREKVNVIRFQAAGIPSAYEAWEELLNDPGGHITRALEGKGMSLSESGNFIFSHPFVEKVARELGWPDRFPGINDDTVMADRAHFFKAYDYELGKLMANEARLPEVKKYIESHNSSDVKQLESNMAQEKVRELADTMKGAR